MRASSASREEMAHKHMTSDQRMPSPQGAGRPSPSPDRNPPWPRVRVPTIYVVLLGTAALVSGFVVARGQVGFWEKEGQGTAIQDFASNFVFIRGVWQGVWTEGEQATASGSAYSVDAHLRIMSSWMGQDVSFALPFAYSPTMLWLLLPLTLLSVPLAYVVWTAAGAMAGATMLRNTRIHWIVGLMVLVTPVAAGALALGQTALLGTAGIFFLAHRCVAPLPDRRARRLGDGLALAAVLWALGAKPPFALTAGAAMLALGIVGPVVLATVLTLVGAALLTPWLGPGWVPDYVALMGSWDQVGADPAFAWAHPPQDMSNLRAFLSVDLGVSDDLASRVSNLVWVLSLGMVTLAGWRRRIDPSEVWALAILSYLLFCSHVSSTDEILLMVVPAMLLPWGFEPRSGLAYLPWIAVPAGLLLSPAVGPAVGVRPSLLWFVELGMAAWIVVTVLRRRAAAT